LQAKLSLPEVIMLFNVLLLEAVSKAKKISIMNEPIPGILTPSLAVNKMD
jgi:hypothetical protein